VLTQVHVQNFKSLVDVTVHLAPGVNVLVGPNGSGKSNFLQALAVLSGDTNLLSASPSRSGGRPDVSATWTDGTATRFVRRPMSSSTQLANPIQPFASYDFSPPAIRSPVPVGHRALGRDGSGLGAIVDRLQNERPNDYERFVAAVRKYAPEVKRVLSPTVGQEKVVGIEDIHGQAFKADELADGLLFLLAITAACFEQPPGPKLLCVEEPERGVHPWRLKGIVEQFRKIASEGAQVVLTTHSDLVVNEFRDFPESIHLFDLVDGKTVVKRMSDHAGYEDAARDSVPGSLWLTGMYGAVPQ